MKKILGILAMALTAASLFGQSAEYTACMNAAKEYEAKKQWAFALNAYYDATGCSDDPSVKEEAFEGYNKLKEEITSGKPGYGTYNVFAIHDEWKNLLADAEKLCTTFCTEHIKIGKLERGKLDYATRTATYTCEIQTSRVKRYDRTVGIIKKGYEAAYKDDWNDMVSPYHWPDSSVSEPEYTCIFNIVDEKGKELVKGQEWKTGRYDSEVTFSGVSPETMDLIDNGKALVNLQSVLRGEDEISLEKVVLDSPKSSGDIVDLRYLETGIAKYENKAKPVNVALKKAFPKANYEFRAAGDKPYALGKTEVTQGLYQAVMGENPSWFQLSNSELSKEERKALEKEGGSGNNPVERVIWYDAIYFCNKLSKISGLTPVYAVNGVTDVSKWNYTPHKGEYIDGNITQNTAASGFRLPTNEEWEHAANGGENYTYSGSNNLDEVGWYEKNSGEMTHPVAQKKANGYGLYDMSGNVWEWVWDADYNEYGNRYNRGGSWNYYCVDVSYRSSHMETYQNDGIGFRLLAPLR